MQRGGHIFDWSAAVCEAPAAARWKDPSRGPVVIRVNPGVHPWSKNNLRGLRRFREILIDWQIALQTPPSRQTQT